MVRLVIHGPGRGPVLMFVSREAGLEEMLWCGGNHYWACRWPRANLVLLLAGTIAYWAGLQWAESRIKY